MLSRAQRRELNLVNQGLVVGCLLLGVQSVSADPARLVVALGASWERWPHAHKFPALSRGTVRFADLLCDEMVRRNRRVRPAEHAYWRLSADGKRLHPVKAHAEPSVDDLLSPDGPDAVHWEGLAAMFVRLMGVTAISEAPRSD